MSDTRQEQQDQPASETIELIDCGSASEKTKGVPLFFLYELGIPPSNKLFLW